MQIENNAFSKYFQNPFLLSPWSVKWAIRKYSAAGPYHRFFPYGPPWNFYSPFGAPKEARTIIGPCCRIFFNGPHGVFLKDNFQKKWGVPTI